MDAVSTITVYVIIMLQIDFWSVVKVISWRWNLVVMDITLRGYRVTRNILPLFSPTWSVFFGIACFCFVWNVFNMIRKDYKTINVQQQRVSWIINSILMIHWMTHMFKDDNQIIECHWKQYRRWNRWWVNNKWGVGGRGRKRQISNTSLTIVLIDQNGWMDNISKHAICAIIVIISNNLIHFWLNVQKVDLSAFL